MTAPALNPVTVSIVTVSDRASEGQYEDRSGPALKAFCSQQAWTVVDQVVVPDVVASVQDAVRELVTRSGLVLLTGGTGIAARDITPEAVRAMGIKELPGFGEVMRARSVVGFPHAILSRSFAGVVADSLVICLPGSPRGAVECLGYVAAAIPHAVDLLRGNHGDHPVPNR